MEARGRSEKRGSRRPAGSGGGPGRGGRLPANRLALAAAAAAALALITRIAVGGIVTVLLAFAAIGLGLAARRAWVVDRSIGGGTLALAGAGIGLLVLLISAIVALFGGDDGDTAASRDAYCEENRDSLNELQASTPKNPDELREKTDGLLEATGDAPAGAICAVVALDSIRVSWEVNDGIEGYEDSADQQQRIADFQADNSLAEPGFDEPSDG